MDLLDCIQPEYNTLKTGGELHSWCPKMYLNNVLTDIETPMATVMSSHITSGICFSETIICQGNQPYLWREHYINISEALKALGLNQEDFLTSKELERKIQVLCQKNHYPPFSLFKVYIWQQIDTNAIQYAIVQERLKDNPYGLIDEKLFLSIYHDAAIYPSPISWIDMPNPIYTIARNAAIKDNCNEACITDHNGRIITTTKGNIYILKEFDLIGVRYTDGAKKDAIEEPLEKAAGELGYTLKYVPGISIEMLNKARECMVASSSYGIRLVDGCGTKRFYKEFGAKIAMKLQDLFIF